MERREKSVWDAEIGQKHSALNKSERGNDFLHQEPVTTEGPSFHARSRTGPDSRWRTKARGKSKTAEQTAEKYKRKQAKENDDRGVEVGSKNRKSKSGSNESLCGQYSGGKTEVMCMQLRAGHGDTQEQAEKSPTRQTIS
jgi:hypothetical protein